MNRCIIVTASALLLVLAACRSQKEDAAGSEEYAESSSATELVAELPARRINEASCRQEMLPALWPQGSFVLVRLAETKAGCEFVVDIELRERDTISRIESVLSEDGYETTGVVEAKGGKRLSFASRDGLAISALVRELPASTHPAEGSKPTRLDFHWYDPARLDR